MKYNKWIIDHSHFASLLLLDRLQRLAFPCVPDSDIHSDVLVTWNTRFLTVSYSYVTSLVLLKGGRKSSRLLVLRHDITSPRPFLAYSLMHPAYKQFKRI